MGGTVLVVTAADDPASDLVIAELNQRGIPVARLDPGDFPQHIALQANFSPQIDGAISTLGDHLGLDEVRSVYWRRPSPYTAPAELDTAETQWVIDQSRWGFGGVLACLPGAFYVNHPWRNRDAEAKPLQFATATSCGLTIPPTLITNDPAQARTFAHHHAPVVYKPLWRGQYHASDGTGRTIWVRTVEPAEIDDAVAGAAHMFQAAVDKTADVRLTVVGERLFPVRIDGAPVLDWREDYDSLTYTPIAIPTEVAQAVHAYMATLGLAFGAFDFALASDGRWVMLECNPNGQWSWFPQHITTPIATALADLLEKGGR